MQTPRIYIYIYIKIIQANHFPYPLLLAIAVSANFTLSKKVQWNTTGPYQLIRHPKEPEIPLGEVFCCQLWTPTLLRFESAQLRAVGPCVAEEALLGTAQLPEKRRCVEAAESCAAGRSWKRGDTLMSLVDQKVVGTKKRPDGLRIQMLL